MHSDTTADAQRRQDEVLQDMGPERRIALAVEMSELAFELCRTGIRSRHPEYTAVEVELTEFRLRLGDDLFRAAFPGRPLLPA